MRLAIVEWLDAVADCGWTESREVPKPARIWSAGWVVANTREHITLATSADEGSEIVNATMTIPRGMVVSVTYLS